MSINYIFVVSIYQAITLVVCSSYQLAATLHLEILRGDSMDIGKRIRDKRATLKITQDELAQILSVTPQYISAVEKDRTIPSLSFVTELATQPGVSIDYLVYGKEGKTKIGKDLIISIKEDASFDERYKKALISLITELRKSD